MQSPRTGAACSDTRPFGGAAAAVSNKVLWPPETLPISCGQNTGKEPLRILCTTKTLFCRHCSNSKLGITIPSCPAPLTDSSRRCAGTDCNMSPKYNSQTKRACKAALRPAHCLPYELRMQSCPSACPHVDANTYNRAGCFTSAGAAAPRSGGPYAMYAIN